MNMTLCIFEIQASDYTNAFPFSAFQFISMFFFLIFEQTEVEENGQNPK